MKKRLFSLALSVCLLLSMLPGTALAFTFPADPSKPLATDQARYEVNGSDVRLTGTFETAWNAVAGSGKGGAITLIQDVTATGGSFGSGAGFTSGGGIQLRAGTVELNHAGHTLDRGLSTAQPDGSVLTVSGGTLTVSGGTLTVSGGGSLTGGKTTANGGGIYNSGSLTLSGVTVSANSAAQGGGVYNAGNLTVSGAAVYENTAAQGGGVYSAGSLTASGAAAIQNNTASGAANNVYLPNGCTVSVSGLGSGARIGVTTATAPMDGFPVIVATGSPSAADTECITSDQGFRRDFVNGNIVLKTLAPDPAPEPDPAPAPEPEPTPAQTGSAPQQSLTNRTSVRQTPAVSENGIDDTPPCTGG